MYNIHTLYTDGTDIFRISKYVPPTESVKGHFILSRKNGGCEVTIDELLKNWKVFNAHAAFTDYLHYNDLILSLGNDTGTLKHMVGWVKSVSLDNGIMWATTIKLSDLELYMLT